MSRSDSDQLGCLTVTLTIAEATALVDATAEYRRVAENLGPKTREMYLRMPLMLAAAVLSEALFLSRESDGSPKPNRDPYPGYNQ